MIGLSHRVSLVIIKGATYRSYIATSVNLALQKGVTVSVKMGPIIDTGHEMKQYSAFFNSGALLTYGYDGAVIVRQPHGPEEYGEDQQLSSRLTKRAICTS